MSTAQIHKDRADQINDRSQPKTTNRTVDGGSEHGRIDTAGNSHAPSMVPAWHQTIAYQRITIAIQHGLANVNGSDLKDRVDQTSDQRSREQPTVQTMKV